MYMTKRKEFANLIKVIGKYDKSGGVYLTAENIQELAEIVTGGSEWLIFPFRKQPQRELITKELK